MATFSSKEILVVAQTFKEFAFIILANGIPVIIIRSIVLKEVFTIGDSSVARIEIPSKTQSDDSRTGGATSPSADDKHIYGIL